MVLLELNLSWDNRSITDNKYLRGERLKCDAHSSQPFSR